MIDEFKKRYGAKLMAMEFFLHNAEQLTQVSSFVCDHFDENKKPLKVKITAAGNRSLSQNAFQHVIYGEISKYLISKGRSDCSPAWVKAMLKNKYLGWGYQTFVDVETGEKTRREVLRSTSKLDKGEAMDFITNILQWAESIGCIVKVPEESEYMQLMRSQNE